jgi:hypothetical protein
VTREERKNLDPRAMTTVVKKAGRRPPERTLAHEVNSIAPAVATAPRVVRVARAGQAMAMRPPVAAPMQTVRPWATAPPRRRAASGSGPTEWLGSEESRPRKDTSRLDTG